jgi:hypothetical protein
MVLVMTDVTWLWWLLEDFDVSVSMSTPLLSDSTVVINIAHNPVSIRFLSILVLMLILHDHMFMMVLSLFSMCLQSSS